MTTETPTPKTDVEETNTPIITWDTCDITQGETDYRMAEDDEIRRRINRLKRRVYKDELPGIIDDRLDKAKQRIKEGAKIPERFLNPDGSLNEEAARKELKKKEQKATRTRIYNEVKDSVFNEVSGDSFVFEQAWEDTVSYLTEVMQGLEGYTGEWEITVENFGWRSQSGHKVCRAEDGQGLLQAILPQTDCTFKIFKIKEKSGLKLQNFHHDSPMGNEWYTITPRNLDEDE